MKISDYPPQSWLEYGKSQEFQDFLKILNLSEKGKEFFTSGGISTKENEIYRQGFNDGLSIMRKWIETIFEGYHMSDSLDADSLKKSLGEIQK